MAIIRWPTRPCILTCRSWVCAKPRPRSSNTAMYMAPAGITTRPQHVILIGVALAREGDKNLGTKAAVPRFLSPCLTGTRADRYHIAEQAGVGGASDFSAYECG